MRRVDWRTRNAGVPIPPAPRYVLNPNADYLPADEAPGAAELLAAVAEAKYPGDAARLAEGSTVAAAVCKECRALMSRPAYVAIHAHINPDHVDSFRFEVPRNG